MPPPNTKKFNLPGLLGLLLILALLLSIAIPRLLAVSSTGSESPRVLATFESGGVSDTASGGIPGR